MWQLELHVSSSHYQVIVLKLNKTDQNQPIPPQSSPDELYPQNALLTYKDTDSGQTTHAYIAAEFTSNSWPLHGPFHVGLKGESNDRPDTYENGPLEPDSFYTVSLRAFIAEQEICSDVSYINTTAYCI